MNYHFLDKTHPQANGRRPKKDEESFPVWFDTDEGGRVTIGLGRKGFINVAAVIAACLRDDPELAKEVEQEIGDVKAG